MKTWKELKKDPVEMERFLREEIEDKGRSMNCISHKYDLNVGSVSQYCKKFNIKSKYKYDSLLSQQEAIDKTKKFGGELVGLYCGNSVKIEFRCQKCNNIYITTPNVVWKNKKIYCNKCSHIIEGKKHSNRMRLSQFEAEQKILNLGSRLMSEYKGYSCKVTIECVQCEALHERYFESVVCHNMLLCHECAGGKINLNKYVNHMFFDTWSHEMAYILGVMVTDGSVYDNKIYFGQKDKCLVEYIHNILCPKHTITTIIKENGSLNYKFAFTSSYMFDVLKVLGVIPNKTYNMKHLPYISKQYIPSFLRGCIDGDGCIYIDNDKSKYNRLCVVKIFNYQKCILEQMQNLYDNSVGYISKNASCYEWCIGQRVEILKLLEYIYSTPGFYLQRKKDKFDQIKEYVESKKK